MYFEHSRYGAVSFSVSDSVGDDAAAAATDTFRFGYCCCDVSFTPLIRVKLVQLTTHLMALWSLSQITCIITSFQFKLLTRHFMPIWEPKTQLSRYKLAQFVFCFCFRLSTLFVYLQKKKFVNSKAMTKQKCDAIYDMIRYGRWFRCVCFSLTGWSRVFSTIYIDPGEKIHQFGWIICIANKNIYRGKNKLKSFERKRKHLNDH